MCSFPSDLCKFKFFFFFFIPEEQNSILTSLRSAHNKNKNHRSNTIDLLILHCVFIKNEEIYVITAPSFVVGKHFFFFFL